MVTVEESNIFEYCEKLYSELEARDGGYYPEKHDSYVFSQAASNYSMPTESINRVYQEYSNAAAQLEIEEIKKMPKSIQKKAMERKLKNILLKTMICLFSKLKVHLQKRCLQH